MCPLTQDLTPSQGGKKMSRTGGKSFHSTIQLVASVKRKVERSKKNPIMNDEADLRTEWTKSAQ
jgi:hypothetical protein